MSDRGSRPIIGITCYVEDAAFGYWNQRVALVPHAYVRALEDAGARPVIVPPMEGAIDETLDAVDGIVFAGGSDLDPQLYEAERHDSTVEIRRDRDLSEIALMEAALHRDVPLLAICRGMQLLNVARGGDLVQHLPDVVGDAHAQNPGVFSRHDVDIDIESDLGSILGSHALVASHHHQAPDRLGDGLRSVAWAPDKTTEGIEDPDARMMIGVLWHPEETQDRALFQALAARAAGYRRERR